MAVPRPLLAGILCLAAAAPAAEPEGPAAKFPSPDGKYSLHLVAEDGAAAGVRIVRAGSDQTVVDLSEEVMLSAAEEAALVWSADSRAVAANFRAGGRSETTALFRLANGKFRPLASPESALFETVVKPARARELQLAGRPADTPLRRIWDKWETVRWLDAATAELRGESTVSYAKGDETVDIAIGVRATIAFDETGQPRIVKAKEVPASD